MFADGAPQIDSGVVRMTGSLLRNFQVKLLLLASASLVAHCFAQEPARGQDVAAASVGPAPSVVELKKNPIELLRELEPPVDAPYELGRGDEITVEVAGRPELTSKHVVGPDGEITLPVAGSVKVADKTREQAATTIQAALSSYYQGVSVSVGVDRYTSNTISVIGAVQHQGTMAFDGTPLLLDAISRAGALPSSSPSSSQPMATVAPAYPEECIIYRGKDVVFTVELRELLEENNSLADYRLKRDDVVYVPGMTKYVSVLGQVSHPGTEQLHSTSTLPELLADAGGVTEKAGRSPSIEIIHRGTDQSPSKIQVVAYKDLLKAKPVDFTLHSGDIIYVPESGFNNAAYAIEKLAPLVNLVTIGALLQ
jgi:polysaccharide export outer membrane protein